MGGYIGSNTQNNQTGFHFPASIQGLVFDAILSETLQDNTVQQIIAYVGFIQGEGGTDLLNRKVHYTSILVKNTVYNWTKTKAINVQNVTIEITIRKMCFYVTRNNNSEGNGQFLKKFLINIFLGFLF